MAVDDIDLFAQQWADKPNRSAAIETAKRYVEANRAELASLASQTMEELVNLVGVYRRAGRERERLLVDMWLVSEYPQQQVTGYVKVGGQ
jgi:hypothetical protein